MDIKNTSFLDCVTLVLFDRLFQLQFQILDNNIKKNEKIIQCFSFILKIKDKPKESPTIVPQIVRKCSRDKR